MTKHIPNAPQDYAYKLPKCCRNLSCLTGYRHRDSQYYYTHTSLSRKIYHCWLILTKYIIYIATVSNITFYKLPYCTFWYTLTQYTETILFQSYVIIVIDIVNANNGGSFHISKQSLY